MSASDRPARISDPADLIIRQFEPQDLPQVMDLDREVFGGYSPQIFTTFYEYHPRTILVAESSGRLAGFILGFKHTPLEGRVFWLAVRSTYQGRGVGRRLMLSLLKIFRQLGAVSSTLEVRISNRKAQALYTSLGFEPEGVCPGYYSDGEAALIMRRRL
ncbi:MAG: ribosomal protein S18-alanine N-acetyltransferase [Methanosarcinales archaeon]|nr:ribosomal protein S18-alanine N-acetyltransferase [Methanosarcinales archaeon]